jgi:hypothetical protein
MMKTLNVKVTVEIRADHEDDDAILQATKEALQEAIEDDSLEIEVEESEDEDF